VFLDLFEHEGAPFSGALHPHSGIATLTYVAEGSVSYIDPTMSGAHCRPAVWKWMQADAHVARRRVDRAGRTRGFQLWIPCRRNWNWVDHQHLPGDCRCAKDGPAGVLLGSYGSASSTSPPRHRSTISQYA